MIVAFVVGYILVALALAFIAGRIEKDDIGRMMLAPVFILWPITLPLILFMWLLVVVCNLGSKTKGGGVV